MAVLLGKKKFKLLSDAAANCYTMSAAGSTAKLVSETMLDILDIDESSEFPSEPIDVSITNILILQSRVEDLQKQVLTSSGAILRYFSGEKEALLPFLPTKAIVAEICKRPEAERREALRAISDNLDQSDLAK